MAARFLPRSFGVSALPGAGAKSDNATSRLLAKEPAVLDGRRACTLRA